MGAPRCRVQVVSCGRGTMSFEEIGDEPALGAPGMTSRQRLLAAYQRQPVDRLPLRVWGVHALDEAWVAGRDPSYRPVIEATLAHGDFVGSWGPGQGLFYSAAECPTSTSTDDRGDWVLHRTTVHTPAGDLHWAYQASKSGLPGMQTEFMVKQLADLDCVRSVPYEPLRPDCAGFFAAQTALGERGVVHCVVPNAISMLHELMGSERFAVWSLDERSRLLAMLETFHQRCLDLLRYLLDQGVGPVFTMYGAEYVAPPLHGPRDFHEFSARTDSEMARLIHERGGLLHIHCHGPLGAVLEQFAELGCDCLHPVEPPPMGDVTLAQAVQRIGHRTCLEGNIQIGDLYAGRTEDIVAQVRHNIEVTGCRGYVLSPTASPHTPVLEPLTVRNYLAMIETAVEYGRVE